jgi:hypothetical protein
MSPLVVDQTKRKVEGVLRTIEGLRSIDYPFADPAKVLSLIQDVFVRLHQDFSGIDVAEPGTVKTLCRRALEEIENYLPILGFIERSADLEAPVELHGPVLRITKRAIEDEEARLVIFSEWDYSPFTYLFPELAKSGVVLVGMPRSESHNALIAPLAGHELAHNVWRRGTLGAHFAKRAREEIIKAMQADWATWKDALKLDTPDKLTDLAGSVYIEWPLTWTVRQAEESFCDLIGLLIFREAYLYAFRYLLAPGESTRRTFNYPALRDRASFHATAASKSGIFVPEEYVESFEASTIEAEGTRLRYAKLADRTCALLHKELIDSAIQIVTERKLSSYNATEVQRAKNSLRMAVPVTGISGIENVMVAAWELFTEGHQGLAGNPAIKQAQSSEVLNELLLKSLEIHEIERRLAS